jgi:predicted CopG family antitoxin
VSDTTKYRTISLRNESYEELEKLSGVLVKGVKLSLPQTIEYLMEQEKKMREFKTGWGT